MEEKYIGKHKIELSEKYFKWDTKVLNWLLIFTVYVVA